MPVNTEERLRMKCSPVVVEGVSVILCGSERIQACIVCQAPASYLCDWKVDGGTCDKPLCEKHRFNVAKGKDLCFAHNNAWERHPMNKQLELGL